MILSDAERKIMTAVWQQEGIAAKELVTQLAAVQGWKKSTTYTMISVCIEKGFLRRQDPGFHCFSTQTKQEISMQEAEELIDNGFDGSADLLVAALVSRKRLTKEQMGLLYEKLRTMGDGETK